MKKLTALLLTMILITTAILSATTVFAETGATKGITVTLDGKIVDFPDAQPFIDENNRTLVPLRFLSEAMGANVTWEGSTSTVTIVKGENTIIYPISSLGATLNGEAVASDTKGVIKDGRTFVPIAFIGKLLNCSVNWAQETRTVVITTNSPATENVTEPTATLNTSGASTFDFESRTVTLNNGIKMPILGIGTFGLQPAQAEESVYHALLDGYQLIDTANAYMNERGVGRGIKKSGVPREEIFVTSKLWPSDYEDAERAIDDTLARLNLEYIDLLLLHQAYGDYVGAYQAMEKAVSEGKVRSIGLSNFYGKKLDEIMNIATIPPTVLQVERNPYIQQTELQKQIKPYGIVMEDWFPLGGRGQSTISDRTTGSNRQQSLFNDEIILAIAKAHNKTAAQVILRWHLQSGSIVIPGSSNPDHILENITIFDFEMTAEEMQQIGTLDTDELMFDHRTPNEETNSSFYTRPMDFNAQE